MGRKNSRKKLSNNPNSFGQFKPRGKKTAPGTHIPVMARDVLRLAALKPGNAIVDCTLGYGGHTELMIPKILPDGRVIGIDVDAGELAKTRKRLESLDGVPEGAITFVHESYDKLPEILNNCGLSTGCDFLLADVGVSSMQVDDGSRGISYKHDSAPLDMRMDTRLTRTAADILAELDQAELENIFVEYSDEPDAKLISEWICAQRQVRPIDTTDALTRIILNAKGVTDNNWRRNPVSDFGKSHPAARVFQALRIVVNDELGRLDRLLAAIGQALKPGATAVIISFHSGEDKRVEAAFKAGLDCGTYAEISEQALVPPKWEKIKNWRSSSAKLRYARRAN